MNILITGAQLSNKGAESMLYITTDEMMKRFPNSTVYFATTKSFDESKYKFKKLNCSLASVYISLDVKKNFFKIIKAISKDIIKFLIGRSVELNRYLDLKKTIEDIDMILDVSGFNLGKQWSKSAHELYLSRIKLAKKYNIPMFLMPQSFGPFDYDADMDGIKEEMAELLRYPQIIFAREKSGYDELIDTFTLNNVRLSNDLVLQNDGIDLKNIFNKEPVIDIPKITKNEDCNNKIVGIVPNAQCFNHGDKSHNLEIYRAIITQLLKEDSDIVLFRHSKEDITICKMIKEMFRDETRVNIEEKEFSCIEYDKYVKQFSFIICSRFHGIVHAYRNGIPCIALGWAIKYASLTECVNQAEYSFDITAGKSNIKEIVEAVKNMETEYKNNRDIIKRNVKRIQQENCFDAIEEWVNNK
ncbi:MAG: polysaccharide pyruvyl transferase family protein [Alphaproteobacteria bacterium]|nr:polysaccharide pyruvyl transferase family protein [Alphaproteobacteria bacterium]